MALELKKRSKQFLKSQKVVVAESSSQPESFGVFELPKYFGEGKNSFKIKPGVGYLKSGTQIEIEILDVNGNPIYYEIPKFKDSDNSSLVSIWIYDLPSNPKYHTPDGRAELIIVGTLKSGGLIRWSKKIDVIKSKPSTSDVIFKSTDVPILNVSSSVETFVNKPLTNGELTQTTTAVSLKYIKSTYGDDVSFQSTSPVFNGEMLSGSIEVDLSSTTLYPRLSGTVQLSEFTSSIVEVVSNDTIRVESPITQSDSRSKDSVHTYEFSDDTIECLIRYYTTGSDVNTQNQIAIANIVLDNVNPISGRVHSVNTLIKSVGLPSADYQFVSNTKVENTSSISFKVPIPTEHLNDPKTIKIQFLNVAGDISKTELTFNNIVFTGGNAYIAGDQSLITGSFHIGNTIGTGIEMAGHSSGYLKSVGYKGFTSASLGLGPGGFLLWSGSGNLQVGADTYNGVGLDLVANDESYFTYTTANGGNLDIRTDAFFVGNPNTSFISGSNGLVEISSSNFHLSSSGDVYVSGDVNAEVGNFKDINILGIPSTSSGSSDFLLETWFTSSTYVLSAYTNSPAQANVTTNFKNGLLGWTASYANSTYSSTAFTSTVMSASNYIRGGTYADKRPPSFYQWYEYVGNNADYPNYPYGDTQYNPVNTIEFRTPTNTDTYTITSDLIKLPPELVSTASLEGISLQTIARFGSTNGFGGFYPMAKIEILNSSGVVLLSTEQKSINASQWLNFDIPISAVIGYYDGSNVFKVYDTIRVRLTWNGTSSPGAGGGSVQHIRWGELRFIKQASSPGMSLSSISFKDSSLSSANGATAHLGDFIPFSDNAYDLGTVNNNYTRRWDDIYATNGTIQTSDITQKENIVDSDLGIEFINSLRPVSYNWVGKNRPHYGFIAQEMSSSLSQLGKTTSDFAGITTGSLMGVRYNELLSPMVKAIQELSIELQQLKNELSQSRG